ncbi:hypothetical protein C2G38_2100603 [Gigaspora rosea]|uniref:Serine-threonine/tyrosine-protein kinase catalytic domain-containing protein n=1 Tax=Gigaspora rosea TaxID=44941 RepID=A0A397USL0_9GLOM|nr:hypothetical protein C2G38_2100603 [Gigaspora rosea]
MVEMTIGQRSFNDYKFDFDLVVMICNGLRPKFAPGTPDCYVELANQCMNSDLEKRPSISEIIAKLDKWLTIIENKDEIISEIIAEQDKTSNIIVNESENKIEKQMLGRWFDFIENEIRIKKQFLESDELSKNFSVLTEELNNIYTSKPYNLSEICSRSSKVCITKIASVIEVPDDI